MNPIEEHDTTAQGKMAAPRQSSSSLVFIDLRENPEAWVEIEDKLPDDASFSVH